MFLLSLIFRLFLYYEDKGIKTDMGCLNDEIFFSFLGEIKMISQGCVNENIDSGRSYVDVSISISYCFFRRYALFSGEGGVIYVYQKSCSMDVSYSMFYHCMANIGGAIYYNDYLSSYLRMSCGHKCSAPSNQFGWFQATQNNRLEYVSISSCSNTTSGVNPLYICSGNQRMDNTNYSLNCAQEFSGVAIVAPVSFSSTHCTFSNNRVSSSKCLSFFSSLGTVSFANIVHNNSPSGGSIVYIDSGTLTMTYCVFDNNKDSLFYGSVTIYHSFIYHTGVTSSINNNSLTKKTTYQMVFFNSYYCQTDIRIPPETPKQSPNQSPILTLKETLSQTNEPTPFFTPVDTLNQTPIFTFKSTLEMTPNLSPHQTHMPTLYDTPIPTLHHTPEQTLIDTIPYTPLLTPPATFKETIPRTYDEYIRTYDNHCSIQKGYLKPISIIFSCSLILY